MNQDQIIEWARKAGFVFVNAGHGPEILHTEPQQYSQKCFERFAALVADHAAKQEREACALVCDELPAPPSCKGIEKSLWDVASMACGDAILARSKP